MKHVVRIAALSFDFRRPVLSNWQCLRLLPIYATFSVSPYFLVHQSSRSFLRLMVSWRLRSLHVSLYGASGGQKSEALISRISIVYDLRVTCSRAWSLPLHVRILQSSSGVCLDIRYSFVRIIMVKSPAGTHFASYHREPFVQHANIEGSQENWTLRLKQCAQTFSFQYC